MSGGTGESTIARLLSFALGFSNYICLDSFPTEKRRQSIIYFLSKFKRQVVIFDLVRATFGRIDPEAIKKKVEDEAQEEIRILDDSQREKTFSQQFLVREMYQEQVLKEKSAMHSQRLCRGFLARRQVARIRREKQSAVRFRPTNG